MTEEYKNLKVGMTGMFYDEKYDPNGYHGLLIGIEPRTFKGWLMSDSGIVYKHFKPDEHIKSDEHILINRRRKLIKLSYGG